MAGDGKSDGETKGDDERAAISFAYDRMKVERFREMFPRARWDDQRNAWIVPGKTARWRINRWLAKEEAQVTPHAEARGKDAFAFEPIISPYLTADDEGLHVRTPYSPKLVEVIRQVPFARWDEAKVWRVPYASYNDLFARWPVIEEEARRSEPEERRKRAEARKGTDTERRARRRATERKRRRIPLPAYDLPPFDRPIATTSYGIIVVSDITGELVEGEDIADLYPDLSDDHVWGIWGTPSLEQLVQTWPAKKEPDEHERRRGWWLPTLNELREARRTARGRERRAAQQPSV